METIQLDLNKRYTFADYLTWADDKRRELIDGFVKLMTPSPLRIHQKISRKLTLQIGYFLEGKNCELYYSPSDVRFVKNGGKEPKDIDTVVQPDLFVVCDESKLDKYGCLGAPDFIIEIVSKGNSKHDVETKYRLYERHAVREYWIVYPETQTVHTFTLNKSGKYESAGNYAEDSKVKVNIFEDFYVDLAEVFKK